MADGLTSKNAGLPWRSLRARPGRLTGARPGYRTRSAHTEM